MARPRRRTDDEIIDAARAIFLDHGPAASLQRVADAVGMSQPALFQRFGTKEALLLRALAPPADLAWMEQLTRGPDDRPLPDQLTDLCAGALAFLARAMPAAATLRAAGAEIRAALAASGHDAGPRRAHQLLVRFLRTAAERGQLRAVDPTTAAGVLVGALESHAMRAWMLGEPLDEPHARAYAAALVDLCWRGLRPPEAA